MVQRGHRTLPARQSQWITVVRRRTLAVMSSAARVRRGAPDLFGPHPAHHRTVGYSSEPGSQRYPPLFRFFYPDCGNFIGIVSDFRSRAAMRRLAAAFRANSDFPLQTVSTFRFVPGVAWSDHDSFWRNDYPAVMVTDTVILPLPALPRSHRYGRQACLSGARQRYVWPAEGVRSPRP